MCRELLSKIVEEQTGEKVSSNILLPGNMANVDVDSRTHDKGCNGQKRAVVYGLGGAQGVENLNSVKVVTKEEHTTRRLGEGGEIIYCRQNND